MISKTGVIIFMNKPRLRLFADYCCGFALWNDSTHETLDGTEEQLLELGVSPTTIAILKTIVCVHDWEPYDKEPTPQMSISYDYLSKMAKTRLDIEIGDRFEITIGSK